MSIVSLILFITVEPRLSEERVSPHSPSYKKINILFQKIFKLLWNV